MPGVVLVSDALADILNLAGGRSPATTTDAFTPKVAESDVGNFPPGTPVAAVASASGNVAPGNANADVPAAEIVGVALTVGVVGNTVVVARQGVIVSLTTEEWSQVLSDGGDSGLAQGTRYYVDDDFPQSGGKITTTPPSASGASVVSVGVALSPTDLLVMPSVPVINP